MILLQHNQNGKIILIEIIQKQVYWQFQMGNQQLSKFHKSEGWTILSKKGCKEIIQSNKNQQIYEKHTLEIIDTDEIKRENFIFEWRNHKRALKHIIQIYQMQYKTVDEDTCGYNLCHNGNEINPHLVVYTQFITKLYENNSKYTFNETEQYALFRNLIESIQILISKFGYIHFTKEMLGYNDKKIGKAWINQNFASNIPQYKRTIKTKEQKIQWEKDTLSSIIDYCNLCIIEKNIKKSKFYNIIEQIKQNKLYSFEQFLLFANNKLQLLPSSPEKQEIYNSAKQKIFSSQIEHHTKINYNSNLKLSNQELISSTNDANDRIFSSQKHKEKKYVMVPVVHVKRVYPVSQQERVNIDHFIRNTYHHPQIEQKSMYVRSPSVPHNDKQNYVRVHQHSQSFMDHKFQQTRPSYSEINKLNPICQQSELHKEINDTSRQKILMIDSMIIVQKEDENDESFKKNQRNTKLVLQESIILRGLNESNQ